MSARRTLRPLALLLVALLTGCAASGGRDAFPVPMLAVAEARAVDDPRYAGLVIDAGTGQVLYADSADALRHPASLTKLMTLYLVFEALDRGGLSLATPVVISPNAARQPPSRLGLKAGETILVRDAILAVVVRSNNDIAVALAEALAGSEPAFAARMNAKAQALGMRSTHFDNATGLPDPGQVTTARDLAILARALQTDFPGRYGYFSTRGFSYAGKAYESTNQLLGTLPGVDGMKTGYIRDSGYNLVASAVRGGRRVIVVVMGEKSGAARDGHVAALIDEYLPGRSGFFASR